VQLSDEAARRTVANSLLCATKLNRKSREPGYQFCSYSVFAMTQIANQLSLTT
jgi:hypothetical protein